MRKRLRSLSLRSEGDICKVLVSKSCDTFVAFEGNMIIGWGVYIKDFWFTSSDFMLYVRKSYRNKGVGRELIKAAMGKYGTVSLHAWDMNSGRFFSKMLGDMDNLNIARGSEWVDDE